MNIVSQGDLNILTTTCENLCVSIFIPTYRAGAEVRQNPIRFKNLLSEAEAHLLQGGMRSPGVQELLEPGQRILEDSLFWQRQSDGLAVFLGGETLRYYRVPIAFEELVVVAKHFYIKPLLPLLSGDGHFYILALSQNEIRLLQGTRYSVDEMELEDVPPNIDEALWFEAPQKQLQFHTAASTPGARRRPAVFHGHGASTETDNKALILRYFRRIDKGLHTLLANERAPMVLAGVDYLLPIYFEANTYPHVVEQGITGNPDTLSAKALHAQAWKLVEPLFMEAQQEAVAQYNALADTGQTSDDIKEVVLAAYHGRIDTLFVGLEKRQWGTFDPAANNVQLYDEVVPESQDLLNLAAIHTLLNGGMVYAMKPDDLPTRKVPIAAIFRY